MTGKELLKKLRKDGWLVDRVNGSHHIMTHPLKPGKPSIPVQDKELGTGLLNDVLKKAGLK